MKRSFISLCVVLILSGCGFPGALKEQLPTQQVVQNTPILPAATSAAPQASSTFQADPYFEQRDRMVKDTIEARDVVNPDVLRALRCVPRHEFVPPDFLDQAYEDHPLPIGYGQTISQPYIVAWMTELIDLKAGEKVLEIGTGSGYQAAVLAELGGVEVYSIEIVPELAKSAEEQLKKLGYTDIHLIQGDGYYGWPEDMLFDAIIVTAAPDHVPGPLVSQLTEAGRLVIPIGPAGGFQTLWKFVKEQGELKAYNLGFVSFVPFTGRGVQQAPASPTP